MYCTNIHIFGRLQGAMIGVVALFMGFAIEAVVIVTVVLSTILWKVLLLVVDCLCTYVPYICTYRCTFMHTHTDIRIHAHVPIHTCTCTHTRAHTRMRAHQIFVVVVVRAKYVSTRRLYQILSDKQ